MNREKEFVVDPLACWFREQQKDRKADWELRRPRHHTSEKGWDLEARRNKLDLLIEAKYMHGPSISYFAGLVTAPMVDRPQRFMKNKKRSWCYYVCWAIGSEPTKKIYQILFDYMARNPQFWRVYAKEFRMKYIFFVQNGKVAKILFSTFLDKAETYSKSAKKDRKARRLIADELMSKQIQALK